MTVTYLGGATLGIALPGLASVGTELQSAVDQVQSLKTQVTADIQKVSDKVTVFQNVLTEGQGIIAQGQALVDQASSLLTAAGGMLTTLTAHLGTAGVGLYRFDGDVANLGSELQAALSAQGTTGNGYAVITIATDGGAITAIQSVFKGS
jgi:predicted PurR-regulated permease PerM